MGFLVLLRTRIANRSAQVGLILTPWGVAKNLILSRLWKTDLSNQGLESWIRVQLLEFDALLEVIDQRRTALTAPLPEDPMLSYYFPFRSLRSLFQRSPCLTLAKLLKHIGENFSK
jgi:hypothetical protein